MKKIRSVFVMILTAALLFSLCACAPEPKWKPYTGTAEGYVYYHEAQRERAWEEDILSLAHAFLTEHPLLVKEKSPLKLYAIRGFIQSQENLYNELLHYTFLTSINELIPKLPELTDDQIPYELQKIVAALGDFHSQVPLFVKYYFPMFVEPFYTDGGVELRVVGLPSEHKEFIYSKLVSINGVGIDAVMKRLAPYGSVENEYGLISRITDFNLGEMLFHPGILTAAGIMKSEAESAIFGVETEDGKLHTISIMPASEEQLPNVDTEKRTIYRTYPYTFKDWQTDYYWYDLLPEDNAAYIRINQFSQESDETLKEMCESLMAELREQEQIDKIIVDLRRNYGGYGMYEDFQRLTQVLRLPQIKDVCVLIDHGSMSRSVSAAYQLKQEAENVTLIGSPAGEGSFYIGLNDSDRTLPNSGVAYIIAKIPTILNREQPFDALLPDITVYPTPEDYMNGVDTVLEAALRR